MTDKIESSLYRSSHTYRLETCCFSAVNNFFDTIKILRDVYFSVNSNELFIPLLSFYILVSYTFFHFFPKWKRELLFLRTDVSHYFDYERNQSKLIWFLWCAMKYPSNSVLNLTRDRREEKKIDIIQCVNIVRHCTRRLAAAIIFQSQACTSCWANTKVRFIMSLCV